MPTLFNILKELEADNSRLAKEAILTREKDNEELKTFFHLALNPYIQFYQRKIPQYKTNFNESFIPLDIAFARLDTLSSRLLTGNAAIDFLALQLSLLAPDDAKVLERVIQKDPGCGVSEATVNKIWPGLIESFPVMLCEQFSEKVVNKMHWSNGVFVQLKSDGLRCNLIIDNEGQVTAFTRNGRFIETFGVFDKIGAERRNVVIDGELLVVNEDLQVLDRKTGNGLINKLLKGTGTEKIANQLMFMAWDLIPIEQWKTGVCDTTYETRFCNLGGLVDLIQHYTDAKIKTIPSVRVKTLAEATKIFNSYLASGQEGVILKDPFSIWEDKRSKGLVKMKAELNTSLLCVGVEPGTGKYEGMIGALVCESSDGIIKVNVGSGLLDKERKLPPETFINKIISVKYNEKILAKDNTWSLFLPIFEEIRIDQNEADSFKKIK